MLTAFQWFSLLCVLGVAFAGGYPPLFKLDKEGRSEGFPSGEAFATGVFLALSLAIMLPSGFHLLRKSFPSLDFPLASAVALVTFLALLSIEHYLGHLKEREEGSDAGPDSPVIPIIMTVMIAIPSFFLGTALGVSGGMSELFIFVAIMAHKGSAGFALALKMARSSMTRNQALTLFCLFAISTPIGILAGGDTREFLSGQTMVMVKGFILSMASGVFLYMGTLHELRHAPLITRCCTRRGFVLLLIGFLLTILVRFLLGEVHHVG